MSMPLCTYPHPLEPLPAPLFPSEEVSMVFHLRQAGRGPGQAQAGPQGSLLPAPRLAHLRYQV